MCEGVIHVEDKYYMDKEGNERGMTGVGGTHVFAVTGLTEGGSCAFAAIQLRPWEVEAGRDPIEYAIDY